MLLVAHVANLYLLLCLVIIVQAYHDHASLFDLNLGIHFWHEHE